MTALQKRVGLNKTKQKKHKVFFIDTNLVAQSNSKDNTDVQSIINTNKA